MQNLQMDYQKLEISSIEVLDQAENILKDVGEEIEIENRIEKNLEVSEAVRSEQELITLIDRIRNTESEIAATINCPSYPVVTGEIRFTSEKYLVLHKPNSDFLINLAHITYLVGIDQRAIFKSELFQVDTTLMWLNNLIDHQNQVTIYLVNGNQLCGQLIRFSQDHLDVQIATQVFLIPISAVILIRSSIENFL